MQLFIVGLLGIVVLLGAIWVVTLENLFRAALSLGVVLIGIAALFLVLEAEFLAFVQILVYVGAILILVVFAIMLTSRIQKPSFINATRPRLLAAVVSVGLCAVLMSTTQALIGFSPPEPSITLPQLGQELVTTLVLPFEVISLVFVAALVGAIALARRHEAAMPKRSSKASR